MMAEQPRESAGLRRMPGMSPESFRSWMAILAATTVLLICIYVIGSLTIQARAAENGRYRQFEVGAAHWGDGHSSVRGEDEIFDTRTGEVRPLRH